MQKVKTRALSTVILQKDTRGKPFNNKFHYRNVIGKLNFLEKSTRPDISYVVHQCACFSERPKQPHGEAVKWLGIYLITTHDQGIIL